MFKQWNLLVGYFGPPAITRNVFDQGVGDMLLYSKYLLLLYVTP